MTPTGLVSETPQNQKNGRKKEKLSVPHLDLSCEDSDDEITLVGSTNSIGNYFLKTMNSGMLE